jgi:CheY-like chemotaxis protein
VKPVRVLVVDDSATMRGIITSVLQRDPGVEVVGSAGDAFDAREAIKRLNPDVLTLDIEMPGMNGIEFLEKIMRLRPMPVIMVSTLTQAGAAVTVEALGLGAVDCVAKPDFDGLVDKVKSAATARLRPLGERLRPAAPTAGYRAGNKLLAIGSSTGGVEALLTVISSFPATCPATVIFITVRVSSSVMRRPPTMFGVWPSFFWSSVAWGPPPWTTTTGTPCLRRAATPSAIGASEAPRTTSPPSLTTTALRMSLTGNLRGRRGSRARRGRA